MSPHGQADAREALAADDALSVDPTLPGFSKKSASVSATAGSDRRLQTVGNSECARQMRMVVRDFAVRRFEAIRPENPGASRRVVTT
jgi:hypothetical protein